MEPAVHETPDFSDPRVLDQFTDDLAVFLEQQGLKVQIQIEEAFISALDKLKLPKWLRIVRRQVRKLIRSRALGSVVFLLTDLLRGLGKK